MPMSEDKPLLASNGETHETQKSNFANSSLVRFCVTGFLLSALAISMREYRPADTIATPARLSSRTLDVEVSNKYTAELGHPGRGYPNLVEGRVVEPMHHTTLNIKNARSGDAECVWNVGTLAQDETGLELVIQFPRPGTYKVSVSCGGEYASVELTCRYVRRELREMDDDDRELFLNGIVTMQHVESQTGQAMYGDDYESLAVFEKIHLTAAGDRRADHFHDGLGCVARVLAVDVNFAGHRT